MTWINIELETPKVRCEAIRCYFPLYYIAQLVPCACYSCKIFRIIFFCNESPINSNWWTNENDKCQQPKWIEKAQFIIFDWFSFAYRACHIIVECLPNYTRKKADSIKQTITFFNDLNAFCDTNNESFVDAWARSFSESIERLMLIDLCTFNFKCGLKATESRSINLSLSLTRFESVWQKAYVNRIHSVLYLTMRGNVKFSIN